MAGVFLWDASNIFSYYGNFRQTLVLYRQGGKPYVKVRTKVPEVPGVYLLGRRPDWWHTGIWLPGIRPPLF